MSNKLKTINIKGKPYVMVNEKVNFFRTESAFENYSLTTEVVTLNDTMVVIKASVKDENDRTIATGYAHEDRGSSQINRTSYVENCETSAIGRALSNLGIGIDSSYASANEVQNAIHQQNTKPQGFSQPQQHKVQSLVNNK